MINKASTLLARVFVSTVWNVDHALHPTIKIKA